jgi:signal transduction histidine kinase
MLAPPGSTSPTHCEIDVEDHGIGFDPKYAEQIFQPFRRLRSRQEYEGTGIGLTICHRIVERHGGTITVRSTPGQGSTFTVRLPLVQTPGRSANDPSRG